MALQLKANRKYPSLPVVTDNPANHTQVLMAIKEAIEIGQRRTSDLLNSFIRVQDLIDLGLISLEGNVNSIIGTNLSQIANIGDLSGAAEGEFLRLRSGEWVNDDLYLTDITQGMVTQHQAALSIAWSQLTSVPALVQETRQVNSGTGLTGGGDLSANRTIALDAASIASLLLADSAVQPGDLAAVATTGDYNDLINQPSIPANLVDLDDVNIVAPGAPEDGYAVVWDDYSGKFILAPIPTPALNLVDLDDVNIVAPGSGEDGYAVVWDDYSGKFILAPMSGGGGTVATVAAGFGIDVDATDPANPEVAVDLTAHFTWSGSHTFLAVPMISGNIALLLYDESDRSANERRWLTGANSKSFQFSSISDDSSTLRDVLKATRGTGVAISDIAIGNSADQPVITMYGPTVIQGSFPVLVGINTSAAADNRRWYFLPNNDGTLSIGLNNDAVSVYKNVLHATRSGAAILRVDYGNSADNPRHQFYGGVDGTGFKATGAPSYTGTAGGLELAYASGSAYVTSFNRSSSLYEPMILRASQYTLENVHNGVNTGMLASGTYIPTCTGVSNIAAVSAATCSWMRVGNVVTVSGLINVQPSASGGATTLRISLPVASNFTHFSNVGGTAGRAAGTAPLVVIFADSTNDQAYFEWTNSPGHTSSSSYPFHFTYLVQ